jgi:hypothetical protein
MLLRRLVLLLLFLNSICIPLHSQEHLTLSKIEDSLTTLQHKILKADNDSLRKMLNFTFRNTLRNTIELPGSFSWPFDSLRKIARLTSPDKKFRIYNWNVPLTSGSNQYFCFIQIMDKNKKNAYSIIELKDCTDSITDPEHVTLNSNNWYGALYYKIIEESSVSGTIYTLLGWQGTNHIQVEKLIEILTIDNNGLPHFGKKIFNKYKDGENKRVIFRYSPVASMVLRYEDQAIPKGKKWNPSRRAFDEIKTKASIIVCDRIVTSESSEGTGQILVPAGDVFDGFVFDNNRWNFIEGIDARNR